MTETTAIALPRTNDNAATDMRHAMMSLPVEKQNQILTEYVDRRNNFRRWLKEQLEEGLHFGFPPGCQPKQGVPAKQWQAMPSLYAAGADLIIDLLALRSEFTADVAAWQQLGSPAETFVIRCVLYSRATGELIGEGRGVRRVGQKGGDANNAIKMAQKSARVDAVLNCYGLRELFTQDLDVPSQTTPDMGVITEGQQNEISNWIDETGSDLEKFLEWGGVATLDKFPTSKYADAIAAFKRKVKK